MLQRFSDRCRSRVTDVVTGETARVAMNTQKKGSRDSVRPKERMCTSSEGKGRKRIVAMRGGERER